MKEYLLRNEENYQNKNSNPSASDINKENTIKKNESFLKGDEAGFLKFIISCDYIFYRKIGF